MEGLAWVIGVPSAFVLLMCAVAWVLERMDPNDRIGQRLFDDTDDLADTIGRREETGRWLGPVRDVDRTIRRTAR